jgi:hypothetical protein
VGQSKKLSLVLNLRRHNKLLIAVISKYLNLVFAAYRLNDVVPNCEAHLAVKQIGANHEVFKEVKATAQA